MSVLDDPFTSLEAPERLHYATGVFLEADDLRAEQVYHRGRLARTLRYLHGTGTAAGLEVRYDPASDELRVAPGVAVDRVGRLVEVPRPVCMRLDRWFAHVAARELAPDEEGPARFAESLSADRSALVADLYVRFVVCPRGRTPAFADGPFDAIDATVPERLRDGAEVSLVLRGGDAAGLPSSHWPARGDTEPQTSWEARMREAVFRAWDQGTNAWDGDHLRHDASTDGTKDPTSVFLARVRIPVMENGGPLPVRAQDEAGVLRPAIVQNELRSIVWTSEALLRWILSLQGTFNPG